MHIDSNKNGMKVSIIFLLIGIIYLGLPNINTIQAGLDPSWGAYLAYATSHGLLFGKDVVFTYGILSQVYTLEYSEYIWIMLIFNIFLLTCYVYWCWRLLGWVKLLLLPGITFIGFGLGFNTDQQIVFYLFLLSLFLLECKPIWFERLLVILSLVIVAHTKFTFSILTFVPLTILLTKRKFLDVGLILGLYLIIWYLFQHDFKNLIDYWLNSKFIASGYNNAMQLTKHHPYGLTMPNGIFAIIPLILSGVFAYGLFKSKKKALLIYVISFFAYKEGVVRDDGHILVAILYFFNLYMFLWLLKITTIKWQEIGLYLLTIVASVLALYHFNIIVNPNLVKNYATASEGDKIARARLAHEHPVPNFSGCVDIYSFNLAILLASSNKLCSRPIFQSYSVYTPELLELNLAHLSSNSAPENIIWQIYPIDYRYPSEDDSLSWPKLIADYTPTAISAESSLILHKNNSSQIYGFKPIKVAAKVNFGERVSLPEARQLLWLSVEVQPDLLEQLIALVFKPNQINLDVFYADGTTARFKLIPGVAKAGFIIAPQLDTSNAVACVYQHKNNVLGCGRQVVAISFSTLENKFTSRYSLNNLQISSVNFNQ